MRLHIGLALAAATFAGCYDDTAPTVDNGGGGGGGTGSGVGDCPGGSTCSPKTPQGLGFTGAQPVFPDFPPGSDTAHHHLAAGGADVVELEQGDAPFTLAYTAQSDDPAILSITGSPPLRGNSTSTGVAGANVTLLGGAAGTTELDIVDPATGLLFDRAAYAISPLATAAAVPTDAYVTAPDILDGVASSFAFWPGDLSIGIALLDAGGANRLVDTSASLTLAGATQIGWDQLSIKGAVAGSYAVMVASGGATSFAQVTVVDHADAIATLFASDGFACFAAQSGGAFIAGVPWAFIIDGLPVPSGVLGPNCVDANAGSTVIASAGGQQATVVVSQ